MKNNPYKHVDCFTKRMAIANIPRLKRHKHAPVQMDVANLVLPDTKTCTESVYIHSYIFRQVHTPYAYAYYK